MEMLRERDRHKHTEMDRKTKGGKQMGGGGKREKKNEGEETQAARWREINTERDREIHIETEI